MKYKHSNIIDFFTSNGWSQFNKIDNDVFISLKPPVSLELPADYFFEIPYSDNVVGYDNYINKNLEVINDLFLNRFDTDELEVLFSKNDSIFSCRIIDKDTQNGSMGFNRYIDSVESLRKIFSQSVTFVVSNKPIFGSSKFEVEQFLSRCRTLQTAKGSFVSRFEIPSDEIYSTISKFNTEVVNDKFLDVVDFLNHEVFTNQQQIKVDEKYISDNIKFINVELFNSIKDFYIKPQINNAEFKLSTIKNVKVISTEKVLPTIKTYNLFVNQIKSFLLKEVPLEAIGFVKKLISPGPQSSTRNEIYIETEISNNKEILKVILNREQYLDAIEAHKNEWPIRIKGMATHYKTQYILNELLSFEVVSNNHK